MEAQCPCSTTVRVGIEVFPSPLPPPTPKYVIPDHILKILEKYKYNWRLAHLSRQLPRKKTSKFVSKIVKPLKIVRVQPPKLDDEIQFYADQISRPLVRTLVVNRQQFGKTKGKTYVMRMNKSIQKTWNSIYNYYKYKAMQKKLRQLNRELSQRPKEKKQVNAERIGKLANPKKIVKPEPLPKKPSKIFDDYMRLDNLAAPKHFIIVKPKEVGVVSPAALEYEPTETIMRLAQVPERFKNQLKPLEPGKVVQSALRYKITELIETLATPKKRGDDSQEEDDSDPWSISKNALKYKATPRIIELAKPVERD